MLSNCDLGEGDGSRSHRNAVFEVHVPRDVHAGMQCGEGVEYAVVADCASHIDHDVGANMEIHGHSGFGAHDRSRTNLIRSVGGR